jgi:hypothetical protein
VPQTSIIFVFQLQEWSVKQIFGYSLSGEDVLYHSLQASVEGDDMMNWDAILTGWRLWVTGDEWFYIKGAMTTSEVDDKTTTVTCNVDSRLDAEPAVVMEMEVTMVDETGTDDTADTMTMALTMSTTLFSETTMAADAEATLDFDLDKLTFTRAIDFEDATYVPTPAPTAYAYTKRTEMKFTTSLGFSGSKESFTKNKRAQDAAISAFKKSLDSPKAKVSISRIYDAPASAPARRLGDGDRALTDASILVDFDTVVVLELLGLSEADSASVYASVTASLSTAVSGGSFASALSDALLEEGVTDALEVDDTSLTIGEETTEVEDLDEGGAGDDDDDAGLAVGGMVGIIVGGFVFLGCVGALVYYFLVMKATSKVSASGLAL